MTVGSTSSQKAVSALAIDKRPALEVTVMSDMGLDSNVRDVVVSILSLILGHFFGYRRGKKKGGN